MSESKVLENLKNIFQQKKERLKQILKREEREELKQHLEALWYAIKLFKARENRQSNQKSIFL